MRILLVTHGQYRFNWPEQSLFGGVEVVESQQIKTLIATGHDVTVATPVGSNVVGINEMALPVRAHADCGAYRMAEVIKYVAKHHHTYDRILFNRKIKYSENTTEIIRPWAHKIREVRHDPPSYLAGFGAEKSLAGAKQVIALGGKVATVIEGGEEAYRQVEQNLRSGKNFAKLKDENNRLFDKFLDQPYFTDFYEVMVAGENFVPVDELTDGTDLVFVGRATPGKYPLVAKRAAQLAGRANDFVGLTCSPSRSDAAWFNKNIHEFASFAMNRDHEETMRALASAEVFLQPTKSESAGGIVAFEAAAHGVPVVTTTDTCRRYLEPYGLFYRVEKPTAKLVGEGIESVKRLTLDERKAISTQIRSDFSAESYANRLVEFLQ